MRIMSKVVVGITVLAILGCAAQQKKNGVAGVKKENQITVSEPVQTYDSYMKLGIDALKSKKQEVAIAYFQQAAALNPKEKDPLQRIAQARFDANEYGKSIVNAQDVLALDPNDTLANSIVTVAGLRLAATSLGVLRREKSMSGSVKTEATGLAEVLRENLGVNEILPTNKKIKKTITETVKPVQAIKGVATNKESDPFGALK